MFPVTMALPQQLSAVVIIVFHPESWVFIVINWSLSEDSSSENVPNIKSVTCLLIVC